MSQHSKTLATWLWFTALLVPTTCAFQTCQIRQWRRHQQPQQVSRAVSLHASDNHHHHHNTNIVLEKYYSYQHQQSVSQLDEKGGAIYRQSILTNEEFITVQKELSALTSNHLNDETASTVAVHRQGARLSFSNSATYKILESGSLLEYVRKISGDQSMVLSTNLPVEVRLYEKVGASMAWHEDDVLYDPPQIEAVITIENNSDCVTMWKDGERLLSRETDPNSVLLLKAGGPLHCVTSLKRGRRLILKCAYRTGNATFQEGIHKETFGASKSSKGKKGKKQKSKR